MDGGLEPFATADCHLTGYQDSPEDNKYTTGEQGSLSSGFPPPLSWNRYITNSLTGLLSGKRMTLSIRGAVSVRLHMVLFGMLTIRLMFNIFR